MQAGQFLPALEAGLGPIAVGAADVDGAELAQHQEHFVEMPGRRIVGIDQQGDILFRVAVAVRHGRILVHCASALLAQCRGMTTSWRGSVPDLNGR